MTDLGTPHIPLGLAVEDAITILQRFGIPVQEDTDLEHCCRVETPLFSVAVYPVAGKVRSVWYDDPTGRESDVARMEKVRSYLARYGRIQEWECRLDNGWMHYWFNPTAQAQMVYGLHKDVIRFNHFSEAQS
jgi:hypothetical protein